jgi:hypothetical protein
MSIGTGFPGTLNGRLNTQRASGLDPILGQPGRLAVTSTNISISVNGENVGFIQSANPSESRNITKVQELGTEGIVQSVPGNTNGGQIAVTRLALYKQNLYTALQLPLFTGLSAFKTLKDQRLPFEISMITKYYSPINPYGAVDKSTDPGFQIQEYREIYLDCWLSNYSKTITTSAITITESATVQYSDMTAEVV